MFHETVISLVLWISKKLSIFERIICLFHASSLCAGASQTSKYQLITRCACVAELLPLLDLWLVRFVGGLISCDSLPVLSFVSFLRMSTDSFRLFRLKSRLWPLINPETVDEDVSPSDTSDGSTSSSSRTSPLPPRRQPFSHVPSGYVTINLHPDDLHTRQMAPWLPYLIIDVLRRH